MRHSRFSLRGGRGERGVTMVMVMSVLATLLLATTLAVGTQLGSMQTSGRTLDSERAYRCAVAGLKAGRDFYVANRQRWNQYLETGYYLTGQADPKRPDLIYIVGISDNLDEFVTPQPTVDSDDTVLLRSACTDGHGTEFSVQTRYLTMKSLRKGGNLPVRPGTVTYSSTQDFTNHGALADCNGCGVIGSPMTTTASTAGGSVALGNQGLVALGVDMRHDQIALAEQTAYPFFFAPGSTDSVIIKINTSTGQVMAKYRTAPDGMWGNPSRTTVDLQGNVWVSNRSIPAGETAPTITKIGLLEAGGCVDRNGNGVIETSTGPTDVRPWSGPWGAGASGAADECVLLHLRLKRDGATTPMDARMLAVDQNNDLYAGGLTSRAVYHLNGATGEILAARDTKQGHYGGVLDRDGFIWSMHAGSGKVEKIWPDLSKSELYAIGHPGYALTIDIYGRIWTSSWTPKFSVIDPDGKNLKVFSQAQDGGTANPNVGCCAQGIVSDYRGDVFLAGSLSSNHVGHYRNDGSFVRNYIVDPSPVGVVVGAAGEIWAAGYSRTATRIDPQSGQMQTFKTGVQSYTYSDATGYVVRTMTAPQGTWTVTQFCGNNCKSWRSVSWGYHEPAGTEIEVRGRAADTLAALQTTAWQRLNNGATVPASGPNSLAGALLQVEVKLISRTKGVTPIVYDVSLVPRQ